MPLYTLDELKERVPCAVREYNAHALQGARIERASLFGSYASGCARHDSDVDLLVSFDAPVVSLFTLAAVLISLEASLGVSVDIVQDPVPHGSLLQFEVVIPLYERKDRRILEKIVSEISYLDALLEGADEGSFIAGRNDGARSRNDGDQRR